MNIRSIILSLLMLNTLIIPMTFAVDCCKPYTACDNACTPNLILFINPSAIGYSPNDYYVNVDDCCEMLKPGSKPGSIEWEKLQKQLFNENNRYVNLARTITGESQHAQLQSEHEKILQPICVKIETLREKFHHIATNIAKRLGAVALLSTYHQIYIEPSHDITQMALDQLNKEYLAGK